MSSQIWPPGVNLGPISESPWGQLEAVPLQPTPQTSLKTWGHAPFTESHEFIQNVPFEVSPKSCCTSTRCGLEFAPRTIECVLALDTGSGSSLLLPKPVGSRVMNHDQFTESLRFNQNVALKPRGHEFNQNVTVALQSTTKFSLDWILTTKAWAPKCSWLFTELNVHWCGKV